VCVCVFVVWVWDGVRVEIVCGSISVISSSAVSIYAVLTILETVQ